MGYKVNKFTAMFFSICVLSFTTAYAKKLESPNVIDNNIQKSAFDVNKKQPSIESVKANSKTIVVNGMVCAFCTNSIEKKFKKEKSVKSVKVDLEKKLVHVYFKKDEELSNLNVTKLNNEQLKKLVSSSGFTVVSIEEGIVETKSQKIDINLKKKGKKVEENGQG